MLKILLKKETSINHHFDLKIYQLVKDFVEVNFNEMIDKDLITKIILRKVTKIYEKFFIKKEYIDMLNQYTVHINDMESSQEYQNLISSIENLNHERYLEIINIHLDRNNQINLEPLNNNEDLVNHVLYKFFSKAKTANIAIFKAVIKTLLQQHISGSTIEETVMSFDQETQSIARDVFVRIGLDNFEVLQNFFVRENTDNVMQITTYSNDSYNQEFLNTSNNINFSESNVVGACVGEDLKSL